jgi:DNA repair photolyase
MKQTTSETTKNNNGTREWATKTVNCCTGCSHGCIYCYGKAMALRFGQVNESQWTSERIRQHDVIRKHPKYPGRVMFPSSHDITPTNLSACLQVLEKLLVLREVKRKNGSKKLMGDNDVLIVSKPHLECIQAICQQFDGYKDKILFRFTIGAQDDRLLSLFEPNAPIYSERKASLQLAYNRGFQTSISVEPMIDSANIDALIADLLPFVTDAIWVGTMNKIERYYRKVGPEVQAALDVIINGQTNEIVHEIYARHRNNPKIKWKEEIKEIIGIPLAPKAGMDI